MPAAPRESPQAPAPIDSTSLPPLPDEVTGGVVAIREAASLTAAVEATEALLLRAGVAISDDLTSVVDSPAALAVSTEQLRIMAREARNGITRVRFSEFAEAFAGVALLPPNDGLLDALDDANGPSPTNEAGAEGRVTLDLNGQPARMATFLTSWVTLASERHDPTDAGLLPLTTAPLAMAALAASGNEPMELRAPFSASRLKLGALDTTLLLAGMRSMLRHAVEAEATGPPAALLVSARRPDPSTTTTPLADPTACDAFKAAVDAHVPLFSDVFGVTVGQTIQSLVEAVIGDLLGEGSAVTQNVGAAFNAAGILFRVHALAILYSEATVELTAGRDELHKPTGGNEEVSFRLEAGVPDDVWERAKQVRESEPFVTALRACMRMLGLPTTSDLVDVGEATGSWRASWDIVHGSPQHAYFGEDQFDGPGAVSGRLERPLSYSDDHSGEDSLVVDILPEQNSDHPGEEVRRRVVVCAWVRTNPPPNIQTILQAGLAGTILGGASQLAAVIADLLAGWLQFSATLEDCDDVSVSFHVPAAGPWRGTIVATTELQQSMSSASSEYVGPNWGTTRFTNSSRTSVDVTDEFFVGGDEVASTVPGYVALEARQVTHGSAVREQKGTITNGVTGTGCQYDKTDTDMADGSWSFTEDTTADLTILPDGTYTLRWNVAGWDRDVSVPGLQESIATVHTPSCEDNASGTNDLPWFPSPSLASLLTSKVSGKIDPENPGNQISGSLTVTNPSDLSVTTITWNLTHDGPIRLPSY